MPTRHSLNLWVKKQKTHKSQASFPSCAAGTLLTTNFTLHLYYHTHTHTSLCLPCVAQDRNGILGTRWIHHGPKGICQRFDHGCLQSVHVSSIGEKIRSRVTQEGMTDRRVMFREGRKRPALYNQRNTSYLQNINIHVHVNCNLSNPPKMSPLLRTCLMKPALTLDGGHFCSGKLCPSKMATLYPAPGAQCGS